MKPNLCLCWWSIKECNEQSHHNENSMRQGTPSPSDTTSYSERLNTTSKQSTTTMSSTRKFNLTSSPSKPVPSMPDGSYLVHATNSLGVWGFGFAKLLNKQFPAAYAEYAAFCKTHVMAGEPEKLRGRCLVIPSQAADRAIGAPDISVVCLFTSCGYGRKTKGKPGVDKPEMIVESTEKALGEFREWLEREEKGKGTVVYSPQFNSGAFKVPWERTQEVIERAMEGWEGQWIVMDPPFAA